MTTNRPVANLAAGALVIGDAMRSPGFWAGNMPSERTRPVFAVCVVGDGSDDLSVGMLYRVLPDEAAAAEGHLRVIDNSGKDYLYPTSRFVVVEVPQAEESRLTAIAPADVA